MATLKITGLAELVEDLRALSRPPATGPAIAEALEPMARDLSAEATAAGKVKARRNNLFAQYSIGPRVVAATFPGLHHAGWIALTWPAAGGKPLRKHFDSQGQADAHARRFAATLVRETDRVGLAVETHSVAEGVASARILGPDLADEIVQRTYDADAAQAADAAANRIADSIDLGP